MYEDTIEFERVVGITIPTIFAFVIFIGLLGNALVILIVLTNRQMQNTTNVLIINLAIADLLFLVFCVPFTAADYALPVWPFTRAWCKAMQYFQHVSAYSSVWTLVLMATDRFLAVVFPIRSMSLRTIRRTWMIVGLLWTLILLSNLPHLWVIDVHQYPFIKEMRSGCHFVKHATLNGTQLEVQAYYYSFNAFGYVVPLSLTLVLYTFMLLKLWNRPAVGAGKRVSQESMRNKKRVTFLVTTVTGVFALCWAPINICFIINSYNYQPNTKPPLTKAFFTFQVVAQVLAYANSCLNPICYAFLSENFRKGFRTLMLMCRTCNFSNDFKLQNARMGSLRFETTQFRLSETKNRHSTGSSARAASLSKANLLSPRDNVVETNLINHSAAKKLKPRKGKTKHVRLDVAEDGIVLANDQVML